MKQINEWCNVNYQKFHHEIVPFNQPAVLRSIAKNWPVVMAALQSDEAVVQYFTSHDSHKPTYTIVAEPESNGRFFYKPDLSGVNYKKIEAVITATLEQILKLKNSQNPHSVTIQAASIRNILPSFETSNRTELMDESVEPTLWMGNSGVVAPHYDTYQNIAFVVAGSREFTLFPPKQIGNLYPGPILSSPGGVPISMVDIKKPDFKKHPNYQAALDSAQNATLYPGDAIFIPTPWWHAVESLSHINALVNYWWDGDKADNLSSNQALMYGMLSVAKLNRNQRESWGHFFEYYVFKQNSDPVAHLPDGLKDLVTDLTEEQQHAVFEFLKSKLSL